MHLHPTTQPAAGSPPEERSGTAPRINARSLSTPLGVAGPAAAVCGHQGDPQGRYPTCFTWPCLLLR